jgi:D-aminopeptidase
MNAVRACDFGISFDGVPGRLNAITDVGDVAVGYTTLIARDGPLVPGSGPVRTGVSAILPRGRAGVGAACAAGWFSLNGNGEMTGSTSGFTGGSGSASRAVAYGGHDYHVGAFVQANFGSRREFAIAGVPLGAVLADDDPMTTTDWFERDRRRAAPGSGSVIVIVATDVPLLPGQCEALARRVPLGLARTGTTGGHFSGDIFLAFSTANEGSLTSDFQFDEPRGDEAFETLRFVPWGATDPFLEAVVQAVEEAVINALVANHTLPDGAMVGAMVGRDGNRSPALPVARVVDALRAAHRIEPQGEQQ